MTDVTAPLNDQDMAELERLLDALPAPLEPLDLMMLDGYLVGVLLQPKPVPEAAWFPHVLDTDGRPPPARHPLGMLRGLVLRRHAELNRAIHSRQWFDPWVFELEDGAEPLDSVMPWVAGFATAMELFPELMRQDSPELLEPLAVLYRAFDPEDLEDADDLLEAIEELEPPADLAEAVESLVNSSLLLADVTRPQSGLASKPRAAAGRGGAAGRPSGAGRPAAGRPAGGRGPGKPGPRR